MAPKQIHMDLGYNQYTGSGWGVQGMHHLGMLYPTRQVSWDTTSLRGAFPVHPSQNLCNGIVPLVSDLYLPCTLVGNSYKLHTPCSYLILASYPS